jgi:hypothetical protein
MTKTVLRALFLISLAAAPAMAQQKAGVSFGPQASWGSDSDLGVGGRVQFGLTPRVVGIVSFDYFFPDCDECTYWELNPGAVITLPASSINPYVGAGLNIARASVDLGTSTVSNTETGVNLIAGLRLGKSLFTEGRVSLGGGEQFVITAGFLFGK